MTVTDRQQQEFHFSGYCLDARQQRLFGPDGAPVPLNSRAYETLLFMVQHPGELLDKDALMQAVWPDTVVEENNLNQCITALRRALGETREDHRFIVTIPGRGYRFVAPVTPPEVAAPQPETPPTAASPATPAAGRPARLWRIVVASALALTLGAVLWRLDGRPVAQPAPATLSIAVLPFENLSPQPDDAFFAAGLHQDIVDQLSKIRSMSVVSRASVLKLAQTPRSIPDIGRLLRVGSVMVGSVRFADGRVRVSTQLVDAATERNLWSETYEQPIGDVFQIEADIATNVARALRTTLLPEERARIVKVPTRSPEAHALYLQARQTADAGDTGSATSLVERAIAIDPKFADAYAYASFLYAAQLVNTPRADAVPPVVRDRFETLSRQYGQQAAALDPDVPWISTALANPALARWRWTEAEQILSRVPKAGSNDPDAPLLHGFLLAWMGRGDQVAAWIQGFPPPDAGDTYIVPYAAMLAFAGQYTAAIEVLERTIEIQPTHLVARDWMAMMDLRRGEPEAAARRLELAERMAGDDVELVFLSEWTYLYGRAGRKADAARLFARFEAAVARGAHPGTGGWAMACLGVGEREQALRWLERAALRAKEHELEESYLALMTLKMNITGDPVLEEREFADAMRRIRGD